uniref:Uncharacterized protein n=1 Tax=Daphnia galeata TaxID=27404 RepID=A0A8J2WQ64_9CRUS|nr:unnamed protein product [Daphnia galeata]
MHCSTNGNGVFDHPREILSIIIEANFRNWNDAQQKSMTNFFHDMKAETQQTRSTIVNSDFRGMFSPHLNTSCLLDELYINQRSLLFKGQGLLKGNHQRQRPNKCQRVAISMKFLGFHPRLLL